MAGILTLGDLPPGTPVLLDYLEHRRRLYHSSVPDPHLVPRPYGVVEEPTMGGWRWLGGPTAVVVRWLGHSLDGTGYLPHHDSLNWEYISQLELVTDEADRADLAIQLLAGD